MLLASSSVRPYAVRVGGRRCLGRGSLEGGSRMHNCVKPKLERDRTWCCITMQHSLGGAFEIPLTLVGSVSSSLGVWYAHQGHRKRCCGSPGCSILYNRHGSGSDRSNKQCLQLLGVRLTDVSSSLPSADVNPGVSTTLRQLGEACGEQSYTYLFDPIQH